MKVCINGKVVELQKAVSIVELLESRGVKPGEVVVQYNGEIVDRVSWAQILLRENDELEILRFVGGG